MMAPEPSLSSSEQLDAPEDAFGSKAIKLCALLGLDQSANVLLVGDGSPDWRSDLGSLFVNLRHETLPARASSALDTHDQYDLVVWTPGLGGQSFASWATTIRKSLRRDGTAFILAENRFAARYWKRDAARMLSPNRNSISTYARKLKHAGFARVHRFLPLPSLPAAEQFVSLDWGEINVSSDASALEKAANKSGLLWTIHDGAAYFASGAGGGEIGLVHEIEDQLRRSGHSYSEPLRLERFDLRDRGALIAFVRSGSTRLVCRVVAGQTIDLVVGRNDEWIRTLHAEPRISAAVKSKIPVSLGKLELRSGTGYVETLTPGIISWKLSQSADLEKRLFAGLADFITQLGVDTAVRTRIDSSLMNELLHSAQKRIDPHVRHEYENLSARLRSRVISHDRALTWNHGDFGYGNAIANPETAELAGVIDWDQAGQGIAGVDLVNFLVQRERALKGSSLHDALRHVGEAVGRGGFKAFDSRLSYDRVLGTSREEREEVVAWATLRFAQRAMLYPALFANVREETRLALQWAAEFLTAS